MQISATLNIFLYYYLATLPPIFFSIIWQLNQLTLFQKPKWKHSSFNLTVAFDFWLVNNLIIFFFCLQVEGSHSTVPLLIWPSAIGSQQCQNKIYPRWSRATSHQLKISCHIRPWAEEICRRFQTTPRTKEIFQNFP